MVEPPASGDPPPEAAVVQGDPDGPHRQGRRGTAVAVVLILALVASGVIVVSKGNGSPRPSASPSSSIAFIGADGGLSMVAPGGPVVSLDRQAGRTFGYPAWSPDGSRVAVVASGTSEASIQVYPLGREGSTSPPEPTVIYRSAQVPPFYLYWSPGGRRVGFLATESDGLSLRVAAADGSDPLDGSGPGTVVRRGAPLYFAWIGEEQLLLHVGTGLGAFLGGVGLDGTPVGSALGAPGDFRSAVTSSDGRFVAYVQTRATTGNAVVVASRDGSIEHEVPVFGPAAVVFDPAADTVATIGADHPGGADLGIPIGPVRLIDAASGITNTLVDGLVVASFWSPDGRTIAALRLQGAGGSTAARGHILPAAALAAPTVAPEAGVHLLMVDVATRSIRSDRPVRLSSRFVNTFLPYFDQYALSHHLWAPDSSLIVLPLQDDAGRTMLTALPADGGDSEFTVEGDAGFWSP